MSPVPAPRTTYAPTLACSKLLEKIMSNYLITNVPLRFSCALSLSGPVMAMAFDGWLIIFHKLYKFEQAPQTLTLEKYHKYGVAKNPNVTLVLKKTQMSASTLVLQKTQFLGVAKKLGICPTKVVFIKKTFSGSYPALACASTHTLQTLGQMCPFAMPPIAA
jgi:hypothetical protein